LPRAVRAPTPAEVFRRQARADVCRRQVAAIHGGERLTYGELENQVK
jgi:hypothetical protein